MYDYTYGCYVGELETYIIYIKLQTEHRRLRTMLRLEECSILPK